MFRLAKVVLTLVSLLSTQSTAFAQNTKIQGYVEKGGGIVKTSPVTSYKVQSSYPNATVTVYIANTVNLASIYSDAALTSPKANPFTADSAGYYSFYAASGLYDVMFSGTGIITPFTLSGVSSGIDSSKLPVTSPVVFLDTPLCSGNFGQRLVCAIGLLPANGGIIDGRMYRDTQVISSNITISKSHVAILLGNVYITTGTSNIVIPANVNGVKIIGQNTSFFQSSTEGTTIEFSGTGNKPAINIGDALSQTRDTIIENVKIYVTTTSGAGIKTTNVIYSKFINLKFIGPSGGLEAATAAIDLEGGAGTGTTYGGVNEVRNPVIAGFKFGIFIEGASQYSSNGNIVIGGNLAGSGSSGSYGIYVARQAANRFYGVYVDGFETCTYFGNLTLKGAIYGNYYESCTAKSIWLDTGSLYNEVYPLVVNGAGNVNTGTGNTLKDDHLQFGFDSQAYVKPSAATVLDIRSADNSPKLRASDLDVYLNSGDNGGNGILYLNKIAGKGSVRIGDGIGNDKFIFSPDGTYFNAGTTFASLGAVANGYFVYCTNCNVATPCTGGGTGAWAFRNGATWKCPF